MSSRAAARPGIVRGGSVRRARGCARPGWGRVAGGSPVSPPGWPRSSWSRCCSATLPNRPRRPRRARRRSAAATPLPELVVPAAAIAASAAVDGHDDRAGVPGPGGPVGAVRPDRHRGGPDPAAAGAGDPDRGAVAAEHRAGVVPRHRGRRADPPAGLRTRDRGARRPPGPGDGAGARPERADVPRTRPGARLGAVRQRAGAAPVRRGTGHRPDLAARGRTAAARGRRRGRLSAVARAPAGCTRRDRTGCAG